MINPTRSDPPIRVEWLGTIAVLTPSPEAASLDERPLEQAATAALTPLAALPAAGLVMDLSRLDYFGSRFIGFLVRCHKQIKESGGRMVVVGASERIRELLHLAALDSVWPFYQDRDQAVQALTSAA
jgi:anti-anti-sigma factor